MVDSGRKVINVWSGPRCLSTSLMYSFGNRGDTKVLDEPLYAHYLKSTGAHRPYRAAVLAAQENNGNKVVREQILGPGPEPILYAKHMAKQRVNLDTWPELMKGGIHVLLIRDPLELIPSFDEVVPATLHETALPALCELFSELRQASGGKPPVVVISDDLRRDPEGILRALCAACGIEFTPKMLKWEAGARPEDGLWSHWWYKNTHASTGFAPLTGKSKVFPSELKPILEECRPFYQLLVRHALCPVVAPSPSLGPAGKRKRGGGEAMGEGAGVGGADGAAKKKSGTHITVPDARNADVLIGIRDGVQDAFSLVWRPEAKVSVLDSGFMLGDGVWEGIRLHKGVMLSGHAHLKRLFEGAKAIDMDLGISPRDLAQRVYETCDANGMESGVHIRLMVSRGLKPTPYQNPATTIGKPTVVVLPEHKQEAAQGPKDKGITLFTVHVRRGAPDVQDPMWNSLSKLNCIAACVQANKAGADEGLMLDPHGFVATCNSVNFFCVRDGEVWAPTTRYQLHGITRQKVLDLCRAHGIPCRELDFTLTEVYGAEECFVTGTFAGQIPVTKVDGRVIGEGGRGPVTERLQKLYVEWVDRQVSHGRQMELFSASLPVVSG